MTFNRELSSSYEHVDIPNRFLAAATSSQNDFWMYNRTVIAGQDALDTSRYADSLNMGKNWIGSVAYKNKYNCIADKYWQPSRSLFCFPRNLSDGKSGKQTYIMYIKRVRSGPEARAVLTPAREGTNRCATGPSGPPRGSQPGEWWFVFRGGRESYVYVTKTMTTSVVEKTMSHKKCLREVSRLSRV